MIASGAASLILTGALLLFYFFYIKPNQDAKNYRKQKRNEEAQSRREADKAFAGRSPLFKNRQKRGYEDSFGETELTATRL